MSQVAVVGASGKIGRRLVKLLLDGGHTPVGIVRKGDQVEELKGMGAKAALVDIETADAGALAAAFDGCNAVVFTAGAGPGSGVERKKTVDYGGSVLSIEAAEQAGVDRFIQVSAISVDKPVPDDADETWRAYVEAKRDADEALRQSALEWTILRPGGLTDDPGTGKVELAESVERASIPRDDVAALIVAVLNEARTAKKQWEAVSGEVPIPDAISRAVEE